MDAELVRAQLFPTADAPAVDIEGFIERHLRAQLDQYAELDPLTLGLTEFRPGQPPLVQINKDLTGSALDEPDSPAFVRGRWRATLAHEAAHVILHRCLFQLNPYQPSLFDDCTHHAPRDDANFQDVEPPPEAPVQRCLKRDISYGPRGADWREVQANRGMAALLMPKAVVQNVFRYQLAQAGWTNLRIEPQDAPARQLIATLADAFQVSKQAMSIRVETLGLLAIPGQGELLG